MRSVLYNESQEMTHPSEALESIFVYNIVPLQASFASVDGFQYKKDWKESKFSAFLFKTFGMFTGIWLKRFSTLSSGNEVLTEYLQPLACV